MYADHSQIASTSTEQGFKQRLSSVVEDSLDSIGIAELTGRYVYMNRAFRNLLELEDEYLNGVYMFEWHTDNHRMMLMDTALPTALRDGIWTGESVLLTRTRQEIPVVLTIYAHKDLDGSYYSTIIRESSAIQIEEEAKLSRLLLQRTIQVQEKDRQQLAQELHDGLGQSLYSIVLGMQYLQGNAEGERNKQLIQQWIDELHKALSTIKLFALQLRANTLELFGLSVSIEQLVMRTRALDSKLKVKYMTNMPESHRFRADIENGLYRITQEALHNSLKHAKAKNMEIGLLLKEKTVELFVKDDGVGFLCAQENEGLGLRHMEERAYAMKGEMDIRSVIGKGTTIKVEIPIEEG